MPNDANHTFANRGDPLPVIPAPSHNSHSGSSTPTSSVFGDFSDVGSPDRRSRWRRSSRVFSKLMSQVVAEEDEEEEEEQEEVKEDGRPQPKRPGFSLPRLNLNLVELNARVGLLFESQEKIFELFTWVRPVQTLCFLAVWTLVCLNPHLIPVLPLVQNLYLIMMPAFLARHPAPANDPRMAPIHFGSATAPAPELAPAPPTSRDFVRNMRDLQNSMENMNNAHDAIAKYVVPQFNFSDESVTTEIFVGTFGLAVLALLSVHMIPWSTLLLFGGWAGVIAGHPAVSSILHSKENTASSQQRMQELLKTAQKFIEDDIILDEPPQIRQVEAFELQRAQEGSNKWEPWLFSPTPYTPLSPDRIAGARARGTQFFEDVIPPAGWSWKEKKWTLDRTSSEWVQQRMITSVEVEMEGEHWVYDIPGEDEDNYMQAVTASTSLKEPGRRRSVSRSGLEEPSAVHKRGEWRRRRWIRDVERKVAKSE